MSRAHSTVVILLAALAGSACAGGIKCPKGTTPNGERTPEVSEAWCEWNVAGHVGMHGPYRAWWPNGKLGTAGQYEDGVATGKWTGWYPSGKLQGYEWFEAGKSIRTQQWQENGARMIEMPDQGLEPTRVGKRPLAAQLQR
jgi:hypothetical protein